MSAPPNSSPRSDGLSGAASTRTSTWSSVGGGTSTIGSDSSSVPSAVTRERSCRPVVGMSVIPASSRRRRRPRCRTARPVSQPQSRQRMTDHTVLPDAVCSQPHRSLIRSTMTRPYPPGSRRRRHDVRDRVRRVVDGQADLVVAVGDQRRRGGPGVAQRVRRQLGEHERDVVDVAAAPPLELGGAGGARALPDRRRRRADVQLDRSPARRRRHRRAGRGARSRRLPYPARPAGNPAAPRSAAASGRTLSAGPPRRPGTRCGRRSGAACSAAAPPARRSARARRAGASKRTVSWSSVPPSTARNSCWCQNVLNGPFDCSSTNRSGRSHAVISLVIVHVTPKCRARHVTNSPSPMSPAVTPPTARSPECSIEPRWASMSERQVERGLAVDGEQRAPLEGDHPSRPTPAPGRPTGCG